MLLGIKPTVDLAFKGVFGSPENILVLIGLFNASLKLPYQTTLGHSPAADAFLPPICFTD